jgi:hypothetical protein
VNLNLQNIRFAGRQSACGFLAAAKKPLAKNKVLEDDSFANLSQFWRF